MCVVSSNRCGCRDVRGTDNSCFFCVDGGLDVTRLNSLLRLQDKIGWGELRSTKENGRPTRRLLDNGDARVSIVTCCWHLICVRNHGSFFFAELSCITEGGRREEGVTHEERKDEGSRDEGRGTGHADKATRRERIHEKLLKERWEGGERGLKRRGET